MSPMPDPINDFGRMREVSLFKDAIVAEKAGEKQRYPRSITSGEAPRVK